ncbi:MAG: hypothetical protein CMH54_04605 [Myxococcales bacterium]|nr:hypothetical protein [Myxococcales bacterium]
MRKSILLALALVCISCNGAGNLEHSSMDGRAPVGENTHECSVDFDICHQDAICTNKSGAFICACNPGYTGDGLHCSNIDECATGVDTCHEDAICVDEDGSYRCTCNPGYEGDGQICLNIDECATGLAGCPGNATCTDTNGSYSCDCNPGYGGVDCVNIDECAMGTDTCHEEAFCTDNNGSYGCTCNPGYGGDGWECTNIDECASAIDNCHDDATCADEPGSYRCVCNPGYGGDGLVCNNIDECASGANDCHYYAICTDSNGGYSCACAPGYAGDGLSCVNIDECATGVDDCHIYATCTDYSGGYSCDCHVGYGGDGLDCTNIDECTTGAHDCHEDAICIDNNGSFGCACKPGYEGDGWSCVNIDECALGIDDCHGNATCADEPGSYSCTCNSGYEGDGVECVNIDECATGAHSCHEHATCTDEPGSYTCSCNPGFEGDGVHCSWIPCEPPIADFHNTDNRNITFVAFGDPQVSLLDTPGCAHNGGYRADQQAQMIAAINGLSSQTWPEGYDLHREGKTISRIRGVLIAGDITENGNEPVPEIADGYVAGAICDEFTPFEQGYGVCGEGQLNYPVYEGYGNHDFPYLSQFSSTYHPVIGWIGSRTQYRANVVHSAPVDEAHYVWKWDDIHFVNLNVKPSGADGDHAYEDTEKESKGYRRVDPHFALEYLDDYMSSDAVEDDAQLVIMTHYGPNNSKRFPDEERDALCAVLEDHEEDGKRVIAWLHGHSHKSDFYEWECPGGYDVDEIPVFNVGAPFYAKEENANSVHFTLFRLGNRTLEALDVSASVGEDGQVVYNMPGVATENDKDDDNPDGLYGGWVEVIEKHLDKPE